MLSPENWFWTRKESMKIVKLMTAFAVVCLLATSCTDPKTGKPVKVPGKPTYAQLEKALEINQGYLDHPDPQVVANAVKNIADILKKKQEIGKQSDMVASNADAATGQLVF